ncbi:hypothetical protein SAMN05892883_2864 [Jatrophihabitans sp. GAS493]|uniref:hypothetical protein n=1 Tax=Jatrophihabitans sp. GAS493 TaxID=1907575 RepID=UPI000BC0DC0C|nr:hypothetical protein [Jatrophihabitans sp. GAS493]SOD73572.1 hypothetical protein SAMN05892883_2864 [Jatrophihabitans sp. GAS493]
MALLRRAGDGFWRMPQTTTYTNEAALQVILAESPGLLHGVESANSLVALELDIAGTGRLDIAVVGLDGSLTLAECKLRSNPEIRREIVGQILAYASGMTTWTSRELESAWRGTSHRDLIDEASKLAAQQGLDFNEATFRRAVDRNLSDGRFRLVLAVDTITPELRRIVEFLNRRTADDLEIIAMEFEYIQDGDIQILIPQTYGAEAAERKAAKVAQHDEASFRTTLAERCPAHVASAVSSLLEHATGHEAFSHLYWGTGEHPSVTPWFHTPHGDIQPWSFYTAAAGKDSWAVNYDWIFKRGKGVPEASIAAFRNALLALPGLAAHGADAPNVNWARRPSTPAATLFADPSAVSAITIALDALVGG